MKKWTFGKIKRREKKIGPRFVSKCKSKVKPVSNAKNHWTPFSHRCRILLVWLDPVFVGWTPFSHRCRFCLLSGRVKVILKYIYLPIFTKNLKKSSSKNKNVLENTFECIKQRDNPYQAFELVGPRFGPGFENWVQSYLYKKNFYQE